MYEGMTYHASDANHCIVLHTEKKGWLVHKPTQSSSGQAANENAWTIKAQAKINGTGDILARRPFLISFKR